MGMESKIDGNTVSMKTPHSPCGVPRVVSRGSREAATMPVLRRGDRRRLPALLLSLSCLIGVGCSSQAPTSVAAGELTGFYSSVTNDHALLSVNTIAVAPVEIGPQVEDTSEQDLTRSVLDAMRSELGVQAFPVVEGSGDAILTTRVTKIAQREGSSLGAIRPASVEFEMQLRGTTSHQVLWSGDYRFNDKALTDNLFDLQKRGEGGGTGWKSSRELLASAFRAAAQDIANRRAKLFIRQD